MVRRFLAQRAAVGDDVLDPLLRLAVEVPLLLGDELAAAIDDAPAPVANDLAALVELLVEGDDAAGAIARGRDPLHLTTLGAVAIERSLDAAGRARLLHFAHGAAVAEQLAPAPLAALVRDACLGDALAVVEHDVRRAARVPAPARVVGVGAEHRARRAAQLVELAVGGEVGRCQLAVVVAVERHAAQLSVRVPGACDAHGPAVAVGLLANEHRLGTAFAARVLAGDAVAVAALVDAVLLLELAVVVVADRALEDAALQLLLAHDRPAFAVAAAHQTRPAGGAVAVVGVDVLAVQLAALDRQRRRGGDDGEGGEDVRGTHRDDCAAGRRRAARSARFRGASRERTSRAACCARAARTSTRARR